MGNAAAAGAAGNGAGDLVTQRLRSSMWMLGCDTLADLFRRMDFDGNGSLDKVELLAALTQAKAELEMASGCDFPGLAITAADVDALFLLFDTDQSGGISYDEFVAALGGDAGARGDGCRRDDATAAFVGPL